MGKRDVITLEVLNSADEWVTRDEVCEIRSPQRESSFTLTVRSLLGHHRRHRRRPHRRRSRRRRLVHGHRRRPGHRIGSSMG